MGVGLQEAPALLEKSPLSQWVLKYGDPIAEIAFKPACHIFQVPGVEGCIAFFKEKGAAISFGDPICAKRDKVKLADAFHDYCKVQKLTPIYVIASLEFSKQCSCPIALEVGEELVFNPQNDVRVGPKGAKLRNKESHALKLGLTVKEYKGDNLAIEKAMDRFKAKWLKSRTGPQLHLDDPEFFNERETRRWFNLYLEGEVIGVAILNRMKEENSWFLKSLMTLPDATRGASDFFMLQILHALRNESVTRLVYGMVPTDNLINIKGLNNFMTFIAKKFYIYVRWLFSLNSHKQYWEKFEPKGEPRYLLIDSNHFGFSELLALKRCLKVSL